MVNHQKKPSKISVENVDSGDENLSDDSPSLKNVGNIFEKTKKAPQVIVDNRLI